MYVVYRCMYVCMYVCMHAYVCICMYAYVCMCNVTRILHSMLEKKIKCSVNEFSSQSCGRLVVTLHCAEVIALPTLSSAETLFPSTLGESLIHWRKNSNTRTNTYTYTYTYTHVHIHPKKEILFLSTCFLVAIIKGYTVLIS